MRIEIYFSNHRNAIKFSKLHITVDKLIGISKTTIHNENSKEKLPEPLSLLCPIVPEESPVKVEVLLIKTLLGRENSWSINHENEMADKKLSSLECFRKK